MHNLNIKPLKCQHGAAVLLTVIMLLIGVTLLIIFAARVGMFDQKISGNEYRHKEAFATAEAALDQTASYLRANPKLHAGDVADGWATCIGSTAIFPCDIVGAEKVYASVIVGTSITPTEFLTDLNPLKPDKMKAYIVKTASATYAIGEGESGDGTGAAIVQVAYVQSDLLTSGELPPLMIPSGDLSGNFNIVPNPHGGGYGIPVSVWGLKPAAGVPGIDTTGANWKTCDHGEFKDGSAVCMDAKGDGVTGDDWSACSCDVERSNSNDTSNPSDINLVSEDDFPLSPFAYVFANDKVDVNGDGDIDIDDVSALKLEIKARAEGTGLLLADCSNLVSEFGDLTRSALVWVTGDCDIGSNITVASRAKPIILVVEGDMRINAGAEVWGIIVGLANFVLNGGPVIHGSAISDIASDLTNGTYSQVYDATVFQNLRDPSVNTEIAKVKYSWRDFTPAP